MPAGTRVTDTSSTLIWETTADAYIAIGDTYVDVSVQCQTTGTAGNGYAVGQINTIVDVFDYYDSCENITESDGGSNEATDDEYMSSSGPVKTPSVRPARKVGTFTGRNRHLRKLQTLRPSSQ